MLHANDSLSQFDSSGDRKTPKRVVQFVKQPTWKQLEKAKPWNRVFIVEAVLDAKVDVS